MFNCEYCFKSNLDIPECDMYGSICSNGPIPQSFKDFCRITYTDESFDSADGSMKNFFHTGISDVILFESFIPRSALQYFLSLLVTASLAFSVAGISKLKRYVSDSHHSMKRNAELERKPELKTKDGDLIHSESLDLRTYHFDYEIELRQLMKAALRALELAMSWLVMLIVMQFNVGQFWAAVLGGAVGTWVFERGV
jgi:hypothetical protein